MIYRWQFVGYLYQPLKWHSFCHIVSASPAAQFNHYDIDVSGFDGDTNLEPSVFADVMNPVFLVSDSLHRVLFAESLHQRHCGPGNMEIILFTNI